MNNSDERKIEYFIALCDDLITCKFLVAESKIQRLLVALSETQPIVDLISDCLEVFNKEREMGKAYVTDNKGKFWVIMPQEEPKILALVFCTLVDIDQKRIDFTDFVKRFFDNEEGLNCYTNFARTMLVPFRELLAEAFGLPKRYNKIEEPVQEPKAVVETTIIAVSSPQEEEEEDEEEEQEESQEDVLAQIKSLANEMLMQLESDRKSEDVIDMTYLCKALVVACDENNSELVKTLSHAAKYVARKIKSLKYLLRELDRFAKENL